ncbi:hypothetical protein [Rhizobium herbae]|uniref:DUF4189 domain-containing protein n=1 Tax=Rhizobium herbae TaxID=508661 RepID=A0ABS4EIW5_9HYPH|nr:hypothetical protein [Rhizobium herbae]MBP1857766.1 hypothetical protein [Rhizobium herbae]
MLIPQAAFLSMALLASVLPANAGSSWLEPVQPGQFYTDLPGVKSPEEAEDAKRIICEQSVVEIHGNPTHGQRYQTVNNCRKGDGPVFQSPRSPRSIERQLRGLNY